MLYPGDKMAFIIANTYGFLPDPEAKYGYWVREENNWTLQLSSKHHAHNILFQINADELEDFP